MLVVQTLNYTTFKYNRIYFITSVAVLQLSFSCDKGISRIMSAPAISELHQRCSDNNMSVHIWSRIYGTGLSSSPRQNDGCVFQRADNSQFNCWEFTLGFSVWSVVQDDRVLPLQHLFRAAALSWFGRSNQIKGKSKLMIILIID